MNGLAVHNAGHLDDNEVRDRFVVRSRELAELVAHLREDDPPRHALVIGPRGMGKSLLLRRVAVTVADEPDLAARWLPVLMPEEMYEVTSVGELWMAALDRLAKAQSNPALAAQHAALLAEPDPSRLAALALERLLAAARASGRQVLLLAENVDMLLDDQLSADEGWALRQVLQTEHDLLLIASAVSTFAQVEDAGQAFYGFFHRLDLEPLDDAGVHALWQKVTGVDLAGERAVPIRILTGGNPRLVTVLGRFSTRPDLQNLRRDLELLIDEYTPYFKAHIEVLPAVERKVFVTLADIWAPATAAEVAERARMTSSKVSSLLARLVRRGAVQVVGDEGGKHRYELTERLYNLYHLLRRPDGEGRVRALVDILVHLYDPVDLERNVFPGLAHLPPSDLDTGVASKIHRHLEEQGVWDLVTGRDLSTRLETFESLLASQRLTLGDDDKDTLLTRRQIACAVRELDDSRAALTLFTELLADEARVLGPDHRDALITRSQIAYYTCEAGKPAEALALGRAVAADYERVLGRDDRGTLSARHQVAYYTGEVGAHAEALALYRAVAADSERVLGPDDRDTLITNHAVAQCLMSTGQREEALRVAGDVLRRTEATLDPADEFVALARWLHSQLAVDVASTSRRLPPRELAEAVRRRVKKT